MSSSGQEPGERSGAGLRADLRIPEAGIALAGLVLRLPTAADLDHLPAIAERDAFTRADLAELVPQLDTLVATGKLVPLLVTDVRTGEILGGGTFRNFDAERAIVEKSLHAHR